MNGDKIVGGIAQWAGIITLVLVNYRIALGVFLILFGVEISKKVK